MKIQLDPGAYMPDRAHEDDAGLDIRASEAQIVKARDCAVFETGVHIQIPAGYCGLLVSKSGLNVKHGLLSTGLIDAGYTGSIAVKLYNNSDEDYQVEAGDKISQLVVLPFLVEGLELVETLEESDRGEKGFGSSGR